MAGWLVYHPSLVTGLSFSIPRRRNVLVEKLTTINGEEFRSLIALAKIRDVLMEATGMQPLFKVWLG
jgi:hypothetical protein